MHLFIKESLNSAMAALTARGKLSALDIEAVAEGDFAFNEKLPVSPHSVFSDDVWDWSDEKRQRLTSVTDSKLRVEWKNFDPRCEACKSYELASTQVFHPVLTPAIVGDLKRTTFVYYVHSNDITKGGVAKPNTVVSHADRLVKVLGHLLREYPGIGKVSDIDTRHIEEALETYPYETRGLKTSLKILCHPLVSKNLQYPPSWNRHDLRSICWTKEDDLGSHEVSGGYDTMPGMLFRMVSEKSCELVGQFLCALDEAPVDSSVASDAAQKQFGDCFPLMLNSYIDRRRIIRERGAEYVRNHTYRFKKQFDHAVTVRELSDFLFDVQCAAQVVILLYTGMRYSEVAGLKRGCLHERNGVHFLKTTLVKHVSNDLPIDYDEWLAIKVVRDAVRALEALSRCIFNRFLFASFVTVKQGQEERPLSNGGMRDRLNKYLDRIDDEERWEDWQLHPHQFRNSLAAQLGRAEVGIPYITMQLKHAHDNFSYVPSAVTLQYGNLRPYLIAQATGTTEARTEVLQNIFGENAKVAGAGAAKHVKRTEDFFRGIGVSGEERKEYIRQLGRSGMPVVPTGFGLCGCNHSKIDPEEEKEDLPPCYGDHQCRPSICDHAIVTKDSLPSIKKRYEKACKMVESPEQAYAREQWVEMRDNLRGMIESVEPEHFQE